jgi:CBS domain containing-hemolysin-like protein
MNVAALLWMVVLLLANGFFVAGEFAFTASRAEVLLGRKGRRAGIAAGLVEHLSDTLAGAQLGITIASLLLGFVAEPAVAHVFETALGWAPLPAGVARTISLVLALLLVVFLHMVVGEMAPKNVAIAQPERLALLLAVPFRAFMTVFRPVIFVLNWLANGILRLFGVEPRDKLETTRTASDLAHVIAAGREEGVIEEFAHRLLSGAIVFSERAASEVMVPRPDIVALPVTSSPARIEQEVVERGLSRIPLFDGDVDHVAGFVHVKDLLTVPEEGYADPLDPARIRPLVVVPESASIRPLLEEMQRSGRHLALVVDEHGGTAGLVSLEDIAEELVGDIRDEHDRDQVGVVTLGEGRYLVAGSTRPDQLEEAAGVELPEGEFETAGGFVMEQLGRIPRRGDRVEGEGFVLRVRRMDGRRVAELELKKS